MKHEREVVAVQWPGVDALEAAREAIGRGCEVAVALPPGIHYALFRHLHPGGAPAHTERVDVAGGAELLEPLASVKGLEDLAKLAPALARAHYRVRLASPEPTLLLAPRDEGRAPSAPRTR